MGSELAVVESARGCKRTSLGVSGLVRTCVTSSAHPMMLREGVWGVVWVEMSDFSKISTFRVKSVGF